MTAKESGGDSSPTFPSDARVLIVKLSSLGDVVHALPVVQDIRAARPQAAIDWVVEDAFAPLLTRVDGLHDVIESSLRRWRKAWWTRGALSGSRRFAARVRKRSYDVVLDLQGLIKSAFIARLARGTSHGVAHRTEGSGFETPARWLVDRPVRLETRIHAVDKTRAIAAHALGYRIETPPRYGLMPHPVRVTSNGAPQAPTLVFVHGTSRDDKLWPDEHWIELGRRIGDSGWRIALPHAGALERARAERLAAALGAQAEVWPALGLDAVVDRMAATSGAIGVDSGLSHVAVALDLPHVQVYNLPTAWRTGPLPAHGHHRQVAVEAPGGGVPSVEAVWQAWQGVRPALR